MQTFQFHPIFGVGWICLIVVVLLGLMAVRPSFAVLTFWKRTWLALLRTTAVCLLALAMLRPGCMTTTYERQAGLVVFLIDISRSMQLPHRSEKVDRWTAVKASLQENAERIRRMQEEQINVSFVAFDGQAHELVAKDGQAEMPDRPDGPQTDLAAALEFAMRTFREQRIVGVVLASDGVQNSIDNEAELLGSTRLLANQEVPLYTVPFGMPADIGQLADVAITNLPDHDTVFAKNRKVVRATLVSRGFANQPITVQLVIKSKNNQEEQIVDSRVYTPDRAFQEQNVELDFTPTEPGSYRMSVRAVLQPNESATLNNELTSFLTVYEGGLRVLMISTLDNTEQSRIRRAIPAVGSPNAGSQAIELDFFPIYTDARSRSNWPVGGELTEAIRNPAVDAIIINNVDARALFQPGVREENLKAIEQAVAAGKGFMMIGGTHSFGPGLYETTPLRDVLPVVMNGFDRQDYDTDIRREYHVPGPVRLLPTQDHELIRLSDDPDVEAAWRNLPMLPGMNRLDGIKDSASVLLASENDEPAMVIGNYGGRGRVIALATDSTWLWHSHGFRAEHKRFWQQIVLWLAFPDGTAKDNVRILLNQRRFPPELGVTFEAESRTVTGSLIDNAEYEATLVDPEGKETPISITKIGRANRGNIRPEAASTPGIYAIRVAASSNGEQIGESEVEFSIYDQDKEKSNIAADPQLLERLSAETKDFGGKSVVPEQLGDLLDEINAKMPELDVEIPKRWRLGDSTPDAAGFLIVFVGVLGVEWYFRKTWGLV